MGWKGSSSVDQNREGCREEECGGRWGGAWGPAREEDHPKPEAQTWWNQPCSEGTRRKWSSHFCHYGILDMFTMTWADWNWILSLLDLCRDGPDDSSSGERARSGKTEPPQMFLYLKIAKQSFVFFRSFLWFELRFLVPPDHQSKIRGQDSDRQFWDWCLVLFTVSWRLWKTTQTLDLWILSQIHEVWEDLQISSGQFKVMQLFSESFS